MREGLYLEKGVDKFAGLPRGEIYCESEKFFFIYFEIKRWAPYMTAC